MSLRLGDNKDRELEDHELAGVISALTADLVAIKETSVRKFGERGAELADKLLSPHGVRVSFEENGTYGACLVATFKGKRVACKLQTALHCDALAAQKTNSQRLLLDGSGSVLARPKNIPLNIAAFREVAFALRAAACGAGPAISSVAMGRQCAIEVMEVGKSLATAMSEPEATEKALALGLGLAEALTALHSEGIAHRDVKESNAIVLPGERVRLIDFGGARFTVSAREWCAARVEATEGWDLERARSSSSSAAPSPASSGAFSEGAHRMQVLMCDVSACPSYHEHPCTTAPYRAPERKSSGRRKVPSPGALLCADVWSFGMTLMSCACTMIVCPNAMHHNASTARLRSRVRGELLGLDATRLFKDSEGSALFTLCRASVLKLDHCARTDFWAKLSMVDEFRSTSGAARGVDFVSLESVSKALAGFVAASGGLVPRDACVHTKRGAEVAERKLLEHLGRRHMGEERWWAAVSLAAVALPCLEPRFERRPSMVQVREALRAATATPGRETALGKTEREENREEGEEGGEGGEGERGGEGGEGERGKKGEEGEKGKGSEREGDRGKGGGAKEAARRAVGAAKAVMQSRARGDAVAPLLSPAPPARARSVSLFSHFSPADFADAPPLGGPIGRQTAVRAAAEVEAITRTLAERALAITGGEHLEDCHRWAVRAQKPASATRAALRSPGVGALLRELEGVAGSLAKDSCDEEGPLRALLGARDACARCVLEGVLPVSSIPENYAVARLAVQVARAVFADVSASIVRRAGAPHAVVTPLEFPHVFFPMVLTQVLHALAHTTPDTLCVFGFDSLILSCRDHGGRPAFNETALFPAVLRAALARASDSKALLTRLHGRVLALASCTATLFAMFAPLIAASVAERISRVSAACAWGFSSMGTFDDTCAAPDAARAEVEEADRALRSALTRARRSARGSDR